MSAGSGVGMGSQIVGGELQGWAAVLDQMNMNQAYQSQANQQQGYANQSLGITQSMLPQFSAAGAQSDLGSAAATREGQYAMANQVPLAPTVANTQSYGGPGLTQSQAASSGRLAGNLGAYQDWQNQTSLAAEQEQNLLNPIALNAKYAANIFPLQMYAAQHSNDDLAMIGSAISSIGGSAGNYMQYSQYPQQGQMQLSPAFIQQNQLGGPNAGWDYNMPAYNPGGFSTAVG